MFVRRKLREWSVANVLVFLRGRHRGQRVGQNKSYHRVAAAIIISCTRARARTRASVATAFPAELSEFGTRLVDWVGFFSVNEVANPMAADKKFRRRESWSRLENYVRARASIKETKLSDPKTRRVAS